MQITICSDLVTQIYSQDITTNDTSQKEASGGSSISFPPRNAKHDPTYEGSGKGAKCLRLPISATIVIITCAVLICAAVAIIVAIHVTCMCIW